MSHRCASAPNKHSTAGENLPRLRPPPRIPSPFLAPRHPRTFHLPSVGHRKHKLKRSLSKLNSSYALIVMLETSQWPDLAAPATGGRKAGCRLRQAGVCDRNFVAPLAPPPLLVGHVDGATALLSQLIRHVSSDFLYKRFLASFRAPLFCFFCN